MRIQPKKIMCAIDFSDQTSEILAYSAVLCKEFHAQLFLLHIVDDVRNSFTDSRIAIDDKILFEQLNSKAQKLLGNKVTELKIDHKIVISNGSPANRIQQLAFEEEIDMVITGSHGKSGFERLLIGSVTEKLLKILHCPLLVIRNKARDVIHPEKYQMRLRKILVGCDFSPDSKLAFDYALSLAQEFQADLYLIHVVKPSEHIDLNPADYINTIPLDYPVWGTADYYEIQKKVTAENREKINALRSRLEKQLLLMVPEECRVWCTPHATILFGEPYRELIQHAKDSGSDMIVLGIRGHTLWEKLTVGSTTDRVIRQAPCPVFAVRPMEEYTT